MDLRSAAPKSISAEVDALERTGALKVWPITTGTAAFKLFRELQRRYDKGESELGAWLASCAPATVLVSCDKAAPKLAKELKITNLDLGQLVVVLVKDGLLPLAVAATRLRAWDNPHTGIGRPAWWTSLEAALAGPHPLPKPP